MQKRYLLSAWTFSVSGTSKGMKSSFSSGASGHRSAEEDMPCGAFAAKINIQSEAVYFTVQEQVRKRSALGLAP